VRVSLSRITKKGIERRCMITARGEKSENTVPCPRFVCMCDLPFPEKRVGRKRTKLEKKMKKLEKKTLQRGRRTTKIKKKRSNYPARCEYRAEDQSRLSFHSILFFLFPLLRLLLSFVHVVFLLFSSFFLRLCSPHSSTDRACMKLPQQQLYVFPFFS